MDHLLVLLMGLLIGRWVYGGKADQLPEWEEPQTSAPFELETIREGPRFLVSVDRVD